MNYRASLALALLVCACFDEGGTVGDGSGSTSADSTGDGSTTMSSTTTMGSGETGDSSGGSGETGDECPIGTIACPCGPDGSCEQGLVCEEDQCVSLTCGNGELDQGEVCDDGNLDAGDGCSPDCAPEEVCALLHLGGTPVTMATVRIEPDGDLQHADSVDIPGAHVLFGANAHASDALVRCAGHMYAVFQGTNQIVRIPVGPGGDLTGAAETVVADPVSGVLCSPDGQHLLSVGHMQSTGAIRRFTIDDGGALTEEAGTSISFTSTMGRLRASVHPTLPALFVAGSSTNSPVEWSVVNYGADTPMARPPEALMLGGPLYKAKIIPSGTRVVLTGIEDSGADCIAVGDLGPESELLPATVQTSCDATWGNRADVTPVIDAQQLLMGATGSGTGIALAALNPNPAAIMGVDVLAGHHHIVRIRKGMFFVGAENQVHTITVADDTITILDTLALGDLAPTLANFQASAVIPCPP